jgi:hypothetical protein
VNAHRVRALLEAALDEVAGPCRRWAWCRRLSLLLDEAVAREDAAVPSRAPAKRFPEGLGERV